MEVDIKASEAGPISCLFSASILQMQCDQLPHAPAATPSCHHGPCPLKVHPPISPSPQVISCQDVVPKMKKTTEYGSPLGPLL